MPLSAPTTSYLRIREYAERWTWRDPDTNVLHKGYTPPANAVHVERVPFNMLAVSASGHRIEGVFTCLKVNTKLMTRLVKYEQDVINPKTHQAEHKAGDIIWVFDRFIIEIDGVRFVTH